MRIIETYKSIQGEGTMAGELTMFVRCSGCNIRCSWCDTVFSWDAQSGKMSKDMTVYEILQVCLDAGVKNVCITGGEPVLQKDLGELTILLKSRGFFVSVFTNGTLPLNNIFAVDNWVADYKLKSAKAEIPFRKENFLFLRNCDEIKFVVSSDEDLEEAKEVMSNAVTNAKFLISPCLDGKVDFEKAKKIAEKIIKENLKVRYSLQLHTVLWGSKRGV